MKTSPMLQRVRYTAAQLQAKLDAAKAGDTTKPTAAQLASVDTLINYRYAKVLANGTEYQPFVQAYIDGVAMQAPWRHAAYNIMCHAVTEMRRAWRYERRG